MAKSGRKKNTNPKLLDLYSNFLFYENFIIKTFISHVTYTSVNTF